MTCNIGSGHAKSLASLRETPTKGKLQAIAKAHLGYMDTLMLFEGHVSRCEGKNNLHLDRITIPTKQTFER